MANIPAAAGLEVNIRVPAGAGAIDADQIPTCRDVVLETTRLRCLKRARDNVTEQDMADAISRHHKIVAKYSGLDAAPAWANALIARFDQVDAGMVNIRGQVDALRGQMDDIRGQMNDIRGQMNIRIGQLEARIDARMGQLDARMGQLDARMERMDAKVDAGHARVQNAFVTDPRLSILRPIVKYIPGHPALGLPLEFPFDQQQYAVGMLPPHGLVPETWQGIRAISLHVTLNDIYWFYNDPRLADNRTLAERREALIDFLMHS